MLVRGGDYQVVVGEAPPDRGMSELIGMVLLIGIVLVGSVTVVVLGAGAISDAEGDTRIEAAQQHLKAIDTRLNGLALGDERTRVKFEAAQSLVRDFHIVDGGVINVTVNGKGACSFEQHLRTIRFQDSNGRLVAYQAGGVFRGGIDGSTTLTNPSVTFGDGSIDVTLVNVSGQVDQRRNTIELNVSKTRSRTREAMQAVRTDQCIRPDRVTLRVNTSFRTAWTNYLKSELGGSVATIDSFSNGTVIARIPQNSLHPSADDQRNQVINLTTPPVSYMTNVSLDGNQPNGPVKVNASKGMGNTYSTFVEPLTESSISIGRELDLEGTNVTGPPVDASIILDRSGSMGSGFGSKLENAKDGAKQFIGSLNQSRDRAGVIYYHTDASQRYIDGEELFSNDFDEVNDTIDAATMGFQTAIYKGLEYSNALFDLKGKQDRRKVAILLTDGDNTEPPDDGDTAKEATLDAAEIANKRDITVYTIGYGANADEELMRDIANETGGQYCFANNDSAVIECFQEFGRLINPQSAIATTPLTANVTAAGSVYGADIPGNTSHIASVTTGSNTMLNLNDPTAPALFSYAFPHSDNETFSMNVTSYQCADDAWNLTGQTRTVGGETLTVARCSEIGAVNESYGADIYVDGERPETLLSTTYAGWQTDVNESLDAFPAVNINSTTGNFEGQSNQALVVFDLPPEGDGTRNTLTLLVQIGLSDKEGTSEVVDIRVAEAAVRD